MNIVIREKPLFYLIIVIDIILIFGLFAVSIVLYFSIGKFNFIFILMGIFSSFFITLIYFIFAYKVLRILDVNIIQITEYLFIKRNYNINDMNYCYVLLKSYNAAYYPNKYKKINNETVIELAFVFTKNTMGKYSIGENNSTLKNYNPENYIMNLTVNNDTINYISKYYKGKLFLLDNLIEKNKYENEKIRLKCIENGIEVITI